MVPQHKVNSLQNQLEMAFSEEFSLAIVRSPFWTQVLYTYQWNLNDDGYHDSFRSQSMPK